MTNDDSVRAALDAVANALQPAALLAARLRSELGERAQDATDLEAAIDRAVRALKAIEPRGSETADQTRGIENASPVERTDEMTVALTVVVRVADNVTAKAVVDEVTSNLESCRWQVVASCSDVVPSARRRSADASPSD
jgi:septal ring factor EnvC (AmiA/AmiB activator)